MKFTAAEKARAFVKNKPLSNEDKESFVYCISAEYNTMSTAELTGEVLSRYYVSYFEQWESE